MGQRNRRRSEHRRIQGGWDPVADWYAGWVGEHGSDHHRLLAIPAVLDMLAPAPGEAILDIGAGSGVLAPHIAAAGAHYTGIEISPRLLRYAWQNHGRDGRFLHGDATNLPAVAGLQPASFDGAVFMLSIQDMEPLDAVLASAAWALRHHGRLVLLMTHPCFRVPRQSGWGWDEGRKLRFRRVDRYLTPLSVPMKRYDDGRRATRSHHRPLEVYINALATCGLLVDQLVELPTFRAASSGPHARAENNANREFPLFLGIRARRV